MIHISMRRKKTALMAGGLLLLCASALPAGEKVTLRQCLEQALARHPSLAIQAGAVEQKKAQTAQSAVDSRMKFSASAGYTRSGSERGGSAGSAGKWNSGLSLSQNIYDFGKTDSAVKSARMNEKASEETLRRVTETVASSVFEAYYSLNKAVRNLAVQQEQMRNYTQRLAWAKSYYKAGTKARIEVTKAETDLANARLALIKAQSEQEQAKAALASAMGTPALDIDSAADELAYEKWTVPLQEALSRAEAQRRDLAAKTLLVEKAKSDLKSAMLINAPDVTLGGSYGFDGVSFFETDEWSARMSVSVPLGDGGKTKAKTREAQAALKTAQAEREKLRQDIVLEVRKAWQNLRQSDESIAAAQAAEKQARENLNLALGRYRAGVGDSLEISDAVDKYATAQSTVISSLYGHKTACLTLRQAMGEVLTQ